jgi:hypothetical protein
MDSLVLCVALVCLILQSIQNKRILECPFAKVFILNEELGGCLGIFAAMLSIPDLGNWWDRRFSLIGAGVW